MEKIIVYILFAFFEYLVTIIITKGVNILNYDCVYIRYTNFKFFIPESPSNGFNLIIKVFFPTIYIIILSGILYNLEFYELVNNIFFVTVIYHILKWLILFFILDRFSLIRVKKEFNYFVISSLLSYFIYSIFISKTTQIFISINELRDGIWIAIITFFLSLVLKRIYDDVYLDTEEENKNVNRYIIKKYRKLSTKYEHVIKTKNKNIKYLTYAIMIYENYNRPVFVRILEYVKLFIFGYASLGVMQVLSTKFITDKESVKLGYNIIKKLYYSTKREKILEDKLRKVIFRYNKSPIYVKEVMRIYSVLKNGY